MSATQRNHAPAHRSTSTALAEQQQLRLAPCNRIVSSPFSACRWGHVWMQKREPRAQHPGCRQPIPSDRVRQHSATGFACRRHSRLHQRARDVAQDAPPGAWNSSLPPTTSTAESWHRAVGGGGGSPGSRRGEAKHPPAQRWGNPAHRAAVRRQRLNRARSSDPTALRQQVGLAKSGSAPGLAPAPLPRRRRASLLKARIEIAGDCADPAACFVF